jgi:uncharacterized protein YjbI with pentapeptide repeats
MTRPDVQAALTVIGRRNRTHDRGYINLTKANLTGADLSSADLSGADLREAVLTRAVFTDAVLDDAVFPAVVAAPVGWLRDPSSGRLTRSSVEPGRTP